MTTGNIFTKFRGTVSNALPNTLSKRFDEPTYLSFKLVFGDTDEQVLYNQANNVALYDFMPHPLFEKSSLNNADTATFDDTQSTEINIQEFYSSIQYLQNANEYTRAILLKEFIEKFNVLQHDYPYYFKSITGIHDLIKVNPASGQRVQNKKISIECLDSIDLRMTYLMNLYRKIAWDDIYQRWVLPDMMRYFTLKIYIAEFRNIHIPTTNINAVISGLGNDPISTGQSVPVYLKILDTILPVWEIKCEMCEFDFESISYKYLDELSVYKLPEQATVNIGIKVGNVKEIQMYPLFQNSFLSDKRLNQRDRSVSENSAIQIGNIHSPTLQLAQNRDIINEPNISGTKPNSSLSSLEFETNKILSEATTNSGLGEHTIDQTKDWSRATNLTGVKHKGGTSIYVEKDIENKIYTGGVFDGQLETVPLGTDATNPATWTSNAITFGKAFASNFIKSQIDKAKINPIPGLGVSFREAQAVMEGKNFIGALGMIRKGISQVSGAYSATPSSELSNPINTDKIMGKFLEVLSQSTATDEYSAGLISTATDALSNSNTMRQIKDYSMATDLIGPGEVNVPNKIHIETLIISGKVPTSQATSNTIMQTTRMFEGPSTK